MSLFHVVSQSMGSFTWRSWSVWGRQCEGRGLRAGETRPGCCTTTTHMLTRRSLSENFWRSTRRLSSPNHPTLQIWPLRTFLLFPELKSTLKGRRFQTIEEREEISLRDLRTSPQNAFQLEKTLGGVYKQWRGVLWRRQVLLSYTLITKFKKKFSFFLDRPRILGLCYTSGGYSLASHCGPGFNPKAERGVCWRQSSTWAGQILGLCHSSSSSSPASHCRGLGSITRQFMWNL
jgi:hypothetical protein